MPIKFIENRKNSGNVFKQWLKGAEEATGDYIWIAEADDLADANFKGNGKNHGGEYRPFILLF